MARYWTGAHTRHRLQFHVVFVPKYRKRVLRGKIAIRLRQLLYAACRMNGWWISEISIQPDHAHIMIQVKPFNSIADVMHILKGGTSKVIRKEFPDLEEFLWGDSFWENGYFAETVGIVDEELVRKYIRGQSRQP
jgi:putative transposase